MIQHQLGRVGQTGGGGGGEKEGSSDLSTLSLSCDFITDKVRMNCGAHCIVFVQCQMYVRSMLQTKMLNNKILPVLLHMQFNAVQRSQFVHCRLY